VNFPLINYKTIGKPLPWDNLIVEIGFGRGEFLLRLARENPDSRILGFEISGISVQKLLKRIREENIRNVFCARIDAYWGFYLLLRDSSVERIYINYPDPWFKKRHVKRRITSAENLYLFSTKLKRGGEIRIRTDYFPFVEYTLREAEKLKCFTHTLRKLSVKEPLTKYESRWLSMGRQLTELVLLKVRDPEPMKIRELKEVGMLFPVEVRGKEPNLEKLRGQKLSPSPQVHLSFSEVYRSGENFLIETLISENGFLQKFFISIRRRGDRYVVDVSPFSQVLRTENIQKAVKLVAEKGFEAPETHR